MLVVHPACTRWLDEFVAAAQMPAMSFTNRSVDSRSRLPDRPPPNIAMALPELRCYGNGLWFVSKWTGDSQYAFEAIRVRSGHHIACWLPNCI